MVSSAVSTVVVRCGDGVVPTTSGDVLGSAVGVGTATEVDEERFSSASTNEAGSVCACGSLVVFVGVADWVGLILDSISAGSEGDATLASVLKLPTTGAPDSDNAGTIAACVEGFSVSDAVKTSRDSAAGGVGSSLSRTAAGSDGVVTVSTSLTGKIGTGTSGATGKISTSRVDATSATESAVSFSGVVATSEATCGDASLVSPPLESWDTASGRGVSSEPCF
ncbi:hypothetical protein BD779DRAFT_359647 [Infundibulicybe gibba]|nr:hypothetical protein BD779DRAFT_359647 [Infundibulicybe gibba]